MNSVVTRFCLAVLLTTIFAVTSAAQVRAPSGNFAVGGDSAGAVGILRVNVVPSLDGPLTVTVQNAAGVVLQGGSPSLTVNLPRNVNTATVSLTLGAGANQITVTDSKPPNESVMVTWQPGVAYAVPSIAANTFATSTVNPVRDGLLWAEAERVADQPVFANLKVHVDPTLPGFDVVVTKTGTTDEVDRRHFDLPRNGVTEYSVQVKVDSGASTIALTAPAAAGAPPHTANIAVPAMTASFSAAESNDTEPVEYDWGRVRGYFAMGMIFSKERDEFSKSDMFLDFTLDKTYLAKPFGPFKNFNTFFAARLTSIPVTATDADGEDPAPAPENCATPDCEAFITSRKAAMMQAGIYLPMYWGFTTWKRNVPRIGRPPRSETNALFIAPLVKGGILTTTGQQTSEAKQFGGDDVFNFYSFGAMIGHYRLHGRHNGRRFVPNTDVAPELISWLTLSYGRWENFEFETPSGVKDAMGNDINVRRRPYRLEALGRLRIPETPFIIGFDGNFGKGPDDVRFLFGTRFDIGKVLHTIRAAAARDAMGKTTPTP